MLASPRGALGVERRGKELASLDERLEPREDLPAQRRGGRLGARRRRRRAENRDGHLALHLPHRTPRALRDGGAPLAQNPQVPAVDDHLRGVLGGLDDHRGRVAGEGQERDRSIARQRVAELAEALVHEREVALARAGVVPGTREDGEEGEAEGVGALRGELEGVVMPRALRGLHPEEDERAPAPQGGVARAAEVQPPNALGGDDARARNESRRGRAASREGGRPVRLRAPTLRLRQRLRRARSILGDDVGVGGGRRHPRDERRIESPRDSIRRVGSRASAFRGAIRRERLRDPQHVHRFAAAFIIPRSRRIMMNPTLYMSPPTTLTCWSCCCAVPPPAPCSSPASPPEPPAPLDDDPGSPFPSGGARSDMPRAVSLAMNPGACDEAGRGGRAEAEDGGGARRRGRRNPGTLIDERATGSVSPRARGEVASVAVDRSTRVERSIPGSRADFTFSERPREGATLVERGAQSRALSPIEGFQILISRIGIKSDQTASTASSVSFRCSLFVFPPSAHARNRLDGDGTHTRRRRPRTNPPATACSRSSPSTLSFLRRR